MSDKMRQAGNLKKSLGYGITIGNAWHFEDHESALRWINERMVRFVCMRDSTIKVVNVALNDVIRKKEVVEKVSIVKYSADTLGDTYSDLIQWLLDLHRVKTTNEFGSILSKMEKHGRELLIAIESFYAKFGPLVEKAASEFRDQEIEDFNFSWTMVLSDPTELLNEMNAVRRRG